MSEVLARWKRWLYGSPQSALTLAQPIIPSDYDAVRSPNAGQIQDVYVVFEGGGAKGVAHIGALHALEAACSDDSKSSWPQFKIQGVGGASIGAIVAALVAVGYRANDLIGLDGTFRFCDRLRTPDGSPVNSIDDLMGRGTEAHFTTARRFFFEDGGIQKSIARFAAYWFLIAAVIVLIGHLLFLLVQALKLGEWPSFSLSHAWMGGYVTLGLFLLLAARRVHRIAQGMVDFVQLRRNLDSLLSDKLWERVYGLRGRLKDVTFADMPTEVELRIVATNIIDQSIQVFSTIRRALLQFTLQQRCYIAATKMRVFRHLFTDPIR